MACVVEDVHAPDGTRSRLFDQLLQVTASDSEALKLWLNVKNEALPQEMYNEHGEPELGDVIDRSDLGFTERHKALYSKRNSSPAAKQSAVTRGILDQLRKQKDEIDSKLSGKISSREKQNLLDRRSRVQSQIDRLEEHSTQANIREVAVENIRWAKKLLNSPDALTPGEILLGIQMMDAWTYQNTQNYLTSDQLSSEEEGGYNQMFLNIDQEVKKVRNRIINHATEIIVDDINENLDQPEGEEVTVEDVRDVPPEEVSTFLLNSSHYYDLSTETQRLVQRFDEMLKLAARADAPYLREIDAELQELAENVDDTSKLLQKDDAGNLTGGLVTPHASSYFETREKAMELLEGAQATARKQGIEAAKASRKQFIRTLRDMGEVVDIRYLVNDLDDPGEFDTAEQYKQYLREEVGENEAERAIRSAEEAWDQYQRDRSGRIDVVESEIANGEHRKENMTEEEYREERMEEFRLGNSPEILIREMREGASPFVFNDGWKYAYIAASPENQSDQWKELTQSQEKLATYLRELYGDLSKLLPNHITRNMNENFLPKIEKDVVGRLMEDGAMAAFHQLGEDFFRDITGENIKQLRDGESNLPDPYKGLGNPEGQNVKFVGDDMDIEDMSKDLLRITEMFAGMAIKYHMAREVEPMAQLMGRVFRENVDNPEESDLLESMEYNIDAMLYGQSREMREGPEGSFITGYNPVENIRNKKKARSIERKYRDLENAWEEDDLSQLKEMWNKDDFENLDSVWENDSLTFEQYENEVANLDRQYNALKGKSLNYWRLVESTIGRFTMISSIGFNIQTGIANGLFGLMAMSVHASGEQDFTQKDFRNALMTFMNLKMSGSSKVGNLMTNMDILYEISEIAHGKGQATEAEQRQWVRKIKDSPYKLMRDTESMIQSVTMMAKMMGTNVTVTNQKTGQEEEISLWEAFGDDGTWKTEQYGERPEWTAPRGVEKNKWTNLRDGIVQLNKRLHGNYDPNSPMDIKKLPMGRLLMMFRSWVPEGFRYRFGKHQWDPQLGRNVKGSYKSVSDAAYEFGLFKGPKELFKAAWNKDYKGENSDLPIDEIDVRGMRKVMKDMQWFLAISALSVAMTQIIDDDEDDTAGEFMAKSVISNVTRVRQDITFYLNPFTAVNIVRNPMPAMRTIMDGARALQGTQRYLTDPDYKGSPVYQWSNALVPSKQIVDTFTLLKNIETEGEFSTKLNE